MTRKTYTNQEKGEAVEIYLEHGIEKAMEVSGASFQSIYKWAQDQGVKKERKPRVPAKKCTDVVCVDEGPQPPDSDTEDVDALKQRIWDLERMLGKKTFELEELKEQCGA